MYNNYSHINRFCDNFRFPLLFCSLHTYYRNIYVLFFGTNAVLFILFHGACVEALVSWSNWIDSQAAIRHLGESTFIKRFVTIPFPLKLWDWSSYTSALYSTRLSTYKGLFRILICKFRFERNAYLFQLKLILNLKN